MRSFFKPYRCQLCIDHYGEFADICFGDIHIKPYSEDKIGVNSVITKSVRWDKLLKQAASDNYLKLDNVDVKILNESQKVMLYPKKRKAKALANIHKLCGRCLPEYSEEMKGVNTKMSDYVTIGILEIQRYVGKHRSLWWIIEFLYNQKQKKNGYKK